MSERTSHIAVQPRTGKVVRVQFKADAQTGGQKPFPSDQESTQ